MHELAQHLTIVRFLMSQQNPIQEMMSYGPGTLVAQTDQYNDTGMALAIPADPPSAIQNLFY